MLFGVTNNQLGVEVASTSPPRAKGPWSITPADRVYCYRSLFTLVCHYIGYTVMGALWCVEVNKSEPEPDFPCPFYLSTMGNYRELQKEHGQYVQRNTIHQKAGGWQLPDRPSLTTPTVCPATSFKWRFQVKSNWSPIAVSFLWHRRLNAGNVWGSWGALSNHCRPRAHTHRRHLDPARSWPRQKAIFSIIS